MGNAVVGRYTKRCAGGDIPPMDHWPGLSDSDISAKEPGQAPVLLICNQWRLNDFATSCVLIHFSVLVATQTGLQNVPLQIAQSTSWTATILRLFPGADCGADKRGNQHREILANRQ